MLNTTLFTLVSKASDLLLYDRPANEAMRSPRRAWVEGETGVFLPLTSSPPLPAFGPSPSPSHISSALAATLAECV